MHEQAWASAAVRRFARETNLLIAGRRFRIEGGGARADALRSLLQALGGRDLPAGPVDHLWLVDTAQRGPDEGALVIDTSDDAAPLRQDDADSRIEWAAQRMPISTETVRGLDLAGLRVGVSMVLEPKTAVLSLLLRDAGAEVAVYAHADETDDAVADALRTRGFSVYADSAATLREQRGLALEFLRTRPDILLDDGSHLIRLAHEETLPQEETLAHEETPPQEETPAREETTPRDAAPELLDGMIGAAEETTSGLRPLRVMAERGDLRVPVIAVNDARTKTWFDNRYGTGQSCVFAIVDALDGVEGHRVAPGGRAVVAGFGPVGEGCAQMLTALGLSVTVAEIDPVRALQAAYAGYAVAPLETAVATADLVVSATGVRDTVTFAALSSCAPGCVIAVAGGVDDEVALAEAQGAGTSRLTLTEHVESLTLPGGGGVLLLAGGSCVNIAAGEGNPIEIMDLSFAVQLEAVRTLLAGRGSLAPGLHPVDPGADHRIATLALRRLGVTTPPFAASPGDAPVDVATTRFGPRA